MKKMKKNKKMKKSVKLVLAILFILIAAVLIKVVFFASAETVNVVVVKDTMESHNYTLDERDSELFEEKYNELKDILSEDEIDFEKYAELISELFIIDLYTLNNKITKYDVGGLEYLVDDIVENFELKASETMYKYIGDLEYNELPEVSSIEIDEIDSKNIIYNDEEYSGYNIEISWDYLKDLEYDTNGVLSLIIDDEIVKIIEYIGSN